MISFIITRIEDGSISDIEVNEKTEISEMMRGLFFHDVLHNGEIIDPTLLIEETCITPGDEIHIVRKNSDEILSENIVIICPEVSKKYKDPEMKILITARQSVSNVLFLGMFVQGIDHHDTFIEIETCYGTVYYCYGLTDVSFNWTCPHFEVLHKLVKIDIPIEKNNCGRKITPCRYFFGKNSELFIHDVIIDEDIIYPEFVDSSSTINKLLEDYSCVIAGSYMLKYLNLIKEVGDIDIFGNSPEFIFGLIYNFEGKNINIYINDMDSCISYKIYGISNICINYVQIKDYVPDMIEYVRENFDISPCITAYDGKKIYMNSKLKEMEMDLFIDNGRVLKYVNRGFKIRKYLGNAKKDFYTENKVPHEYFNGKIADRSLFWRKRTLQEHDGMFVLIALCINRGLIHKFKYKEEILDAFSAGFFRL